MKILVVGVLGDYHQRLIDLMKEVRGEKIQIVHDYEAPPEINKCWIDEAEEMIKLHIRDDDLQQMFWTSSPGRKKAQWKQNPLERFKKR